MKLERSYSITEIAEILNSPFHGNKEVSILGINEIHRVENGDIVFVDHPKYYDKALNSAASVVLIDKKVEVPEGKAIIVCDEPFTSFNAILDHFNPFIFPSESDDESVEIGANSRIHPSAVIGANVSIGKNTMILPNVSIGDNVTIGDNVIIQSGTVIGSFGFYYKNRPEHFDRLKSAGTVVIEDDVEIGANCSIDRGVTAETRIGKGTKIDNQVQIGHDTIIGKKCLIAAQCGIAGCVKLGDEVIFWGQIGMGSGIEVGDKAIVLGQSGVTKSLEGGKVYFGTPAVENKKKLLEMALVRRLPELVEKMKSYGE